MFSGTSCIHVKHLLWPEGPEAQGQCPSPLAVLAGHCPLSLRASPDAEPPGLTAARPDKIHIHLSMASSRPADPLLIW